MDETAYPETAGVDTYGLNMTKSIHEYKDLTDSLGINTSDLGCVMLPVKPVNGIWDNEQISKLLDQTDLYVSSNPDYFWVNGDVLDIGHVTLLYGLLTPAYEQKETVDAILEKWTKPRYLSSRRIKSFPSPYNDENYAAIVACVEDPSLTDAYHRLSYLPHINTFAKYEPHVTLFYVRANVAEYWVDVLSRFPLEFEVTPGDLDYGEKPEKSE